MHRKYWAIIIMVGIIVGLVASFGTYNLDTGKNGSSGSTGGSLTLIRPPIALAQTESTTFPADEAGLAAYVKVDASLDLEQAATTFTSLIRQGGNWVIGEVPVTTLPEWDIRGTRTINVPVYIDSEGWVVAYLPRFSLNYPRDIRQWAANIMVWTVIDKENPQLNDITTTTLEEAIDKVLAAVGIDFTPLQDQVGYYDFQFPDAEKIILVAKVGKTQIDTPVEMQLTIAEGAQIYRASISVVAESRLRFFPHSYYHFSTGNCDCNPWVNTFPVAPSSFPVGSVWACGFDTDIPEGEVVGIAVVVVYSTP